MSLIPTGRMKKYEPLDRKNFISFADFYEYHRVKSVQI